MKTTKIELDGETYVLDINRAKELGVLSEDLDAKYPLPLNIGDVYKHETGRTNPLLLVKAIYCVEPSTGHVPVSQKIYTLLGLGLAPNSDPFYRELHTIEEIKAYLRERNMRYSHNIESKVGYAVHSKS